MPYADPEKRRERQRAYRQSEAGKKAHCKSRRKWYQTKGKRYHQSWALQRKYGLTVSDRDHMLAAQNGRCAICKTDAPAAKGWCVDHDHQTSKVRGLLCFKCNTMLGLVGDNPTTLISAVSYLKQHEPDNV